MKKLVLLFIFVFCLTLNSVFAESVKSSINNVISQSSINKGAISVSVRDMSNGKTVYELNPKMPVSPASIQKIVTSTPAIITLGSDYRFRTRLYKNSNNEYLIVLGADPYLTSKDLDKLVRVISKEPTSIGIDDSIIDKNEWGEGWQWDDDLNPLMPKFSAYNIDKNFTFLGYDENPYKYLNKSDLFICTSFAEGFSTAATEALIVGTPVLTTDCAGMKEMLGENNEYGIIVENSEEGIYKGLKSILENKDILKYYKRQAIERGKNFNTENTVKEVEEMLLEVYGG